MSDDRANKIARKTAKIGDSMVQLARSMEGDVALISPGHRMALSIMFAKIAALAVVLAKYAQCVTEADFEAVEGELDDLVSDAAENDELGEYGMGGDWWKTGLWDE